MDWNALVESMRGDSDDQGIARRLLEIGKTMTTGAAHMYLLGEFLLERKKEIRHGKFGAWVRMEGLAPRTARKYMAFARRMATWTSENGTRVPFCTLTALVQGDLGASQKSESDRSAPATDDEANEGLLAGVEEPDFAGGDAEETTVGETSASSEGADLRQDMPVEGGEPEEGQRRSEAGADARESHRKVGAEDHDPVAIIEHFVAAIEGLGELVVEGMSRAEIRRLAEAMKRAKATLNTINARAVRRMKTINAVELEEAS